MRLLYLAYRFPYPPDKGERIRAFHQIRALAQGAGVEVHLVCPVTAPPPPEHVAALREHCASVVVIEGSARAMLVREALRLAAGAPRMTGTYDSRALRRAAETEALRHDVDCVLASTVHVARAALRARRGGRAVVLDAVDVYSQVWLDGARRAPLPAGWLAQLEGRRLAAYEREAAAAADAAVVCSDAEAELWLRVTASAAAVVRNGVDLDYFAPRTPPATGAPSIVFTGQMDYLPNVDAVRFFCSDVFPRLRVRHPSVSFSIVGRSPARAVRALAGTPGVHVVGEVPDVRPYLAGATAAVAPLRVARGVQNKVLEAMAMAVPVVATSAALAGLDRDCGEGARRADDPVALASEIDALLSDPAQRSRRALAARAYVEGRHRWDHEGLRLHDVLRDACARRARADRREPRAGSVSARADEGAGPVARDAASASEPAKRVGLSTAAAAGGTRRP